MAYDSVNVYVAFVIALSLGVKAADVHYVSESPRFIGPIANVTVPVGREAILECTVDNLSTFRIAWLRVDTQTILTIYIHVITKNHRINVSHSEHKTWHLHIKDVRESDRGWYMCQVNTDPMKSQIGYLDVVVPPDILDYPTSTDMVVREGSNVSLRCAATGSPEPFIAWRREGGESIPLGNGQEAPSVEGSVFNITRVNRLHMGPYLCIASNGVPPSVSKRISLIVHFPPMIWIQNQLVGAIVGQEITLECHSEAYPKSINYWTKDSGNIISHEFDTILSEVGVPLRGNISFDADCVCNIGKGSSNLWASYYWSNGAKYEPVLVDNAYKVHMKLTIKSVSSSDYGSYKCVSKNSLGETDGTIKLYHIPSPSTQTEETTTILALSTVYNFEKLTENNTRQGKKKKQKTDHSNSIISEPKVTKVKDGGQRNPVSDTNKEKLEAYNEDVQTTSSSNIPSTKIASSLLITIFLLFLM